MGLIVLFEILRVSVHEVAFLAPVSTDCLESPFRFFSLAAVQFFLKLCNLGFHEEIARSERSRFNAPIWVKFREKAELQKLEQYSQSGGEKSVSTMLYLLCLQMVTDTPFRVVDEINQGMDPVNERIVFSRIVESTSKKRASDSKIPPQYFLATPKLLPNLVYPPDAGIVALCAYNGPGMVEGTRWNAQQ
jgi:hypothetical protein